VVGVGALLFAQGHPYLPTRTWGAYLGFVAVPLLYLEVWTCQRERSFVSRFSLSFLACVVAFVGAVLAYFQARYTDAVWSTGSLSAAFAALAGEPAWLSAIYLGGRGDPTVPHYFHLVGAAQCFAMGCGTTLFLRASSSTLANQGFPPAKARARSLRQTVFVYGLFVLVVVVTDIAGYWLTQDRGWQDRFVVFFPLFVVYYSVPGVLALPFVYWLADGAWLLPPAAPPSPQQGVRPRAEQPTTDPRIT
jgi:hypothetical protein